MLEAILYTDTVIEAGTVAAPLQKTVGKASYRLGPFKLYEAELKTGNGGFSRLAPFDLVLTYARAFSAHSLADASLKEMARITGKDELTIEPLRAELTACFANVRRGDIITGHSLSENEATFSHNGQHQCRIHWVGFRSDFFGIWLSDNARFDEQASLLKGAKNQ